MQLWGTHCVNGGVVWCRNRALSTPRNPIDQQGAVVSGHISTVATIACQPDVLQLAAAVIVGWYQPAVTYRCTVQLSGIDRIRNSCMGVSGLVAVRESNDDVDDVGFCVHVPDRSGSTVCI
jgi:hypothetical protein